MRLRIAIVAIFVATSAFAQDTGQSAPAPASAIQEPPQGVPAATSNVVSVGPQQFNLVLDQNDLAALSIALNELPKRVADPLIMKINAQLQAQVKK